jgi:hypothetical protein
MTPPPLAGVRAAHRGSSGTIGPQVAYLRPSGPFGALTILPATADASTPGRNAHMNRMRTGSIQRPGYVWLGIASQVFVGIMAIPVGLVMVVDPNGSPLGIPNEWVADSAFGSFLVPGLFLLLVNGFGQLAAAALAVLRHPLAPWLMAALGLGLLAWIAVQVLIIPLSFLQPAIFLVGLVQGTVALLWLRQLGHLRFGHSGGSAT